MTEKILANIAELVDAQTDYVVELRHRLHRIPEPGFGEKRTASLIAEELGKLDLEVRAGVGETGIVADLVTGRPGAYVAVRADMDALPLKELTGVDYASENEGYSHCCGHDGHAAALVATARVLAQIRDQLAGKVRFIFQPAEEMLEEGTEAEWQIRTCEELGGDLGSLELEIAKRTLGKERLGATEQEKTGDVR